MDASVIFLFAYKRGDRSPCVGMDFQGAGMLQYLLVDSGSAPSGKKNIGFPNLFDQFFFTAAKLRPVI